MSKDHLQRFTRLASFQDSDQKDFSQNEVYWYSYFLSESGTLKRCGKWQTCEFTERRNNGMVQINSQCKQKRACNNSVKHNKYECKQLGKRDRKLINMIYKIIIFQEMVSWFHRPVGNASPMLCYSPKCSTCLTVKNTLILCLAMINSIFKLNAFDWRFSKLFKERLQEIIKIMYLLKNLSFLKNIIN